jgi:hypothetical protein
LSTILRKINAKKKLCKRLPFYTVFRFEKFARGIKQCDPLPEKNTIETNKAGKTFSKGMGSQMSKFFGTLVSNTLSRKLTH